MRFIRATSFTFATQWVAPTVILKQAAMNSR
jgi:hypothetical protein